MSCVQRQDRLRGGVNRARPGPASALRKWLCFAPEPAGMAACVARIMARRFPALLFGPNPARTARPFARIIAASGGGRLRLCRRSSREQTGKRGPSPDRRVAFRRLFYALYGCQVRTQLERCAQPHQIASPCGRCRHCRSDQWRDNDDRSAGHLRCYSGPGFRLPALASPASPLDCTPVKTTPKKWGAARTPRQVSPFRLTLCSPLGFLPAA